MCNPPSLPLLGNSCCKPFKRLLEHKTSVIFSWPPIMTRAMRLTGVLLEIFAFTIFSPFAVHSVDLDELTLALSQFPRNTTFVDLRNINFTFTYIRDFSFKQLISLDSLLMDSCGIERIEEFAFSSTQLILISSRSNKLKDILWAVQISGTLRNLYLGENQIAFLPTGTLSKLSQMRFLDLSDNPVVVAPDVSALLQLRYFYFRGIQIKCCSAMAKYKDLPMIRIDEKPCHGPPEIANISWDNITKDQLEAIPCCKYACHLYEIMQDQL